MRGIIGITLIIIGGVGPNMANIDNSVIKIFGAVLAMVGLYLLVKNKNRSY